MVIQQLSRSRDPGLGAPERGRGDTPRLPDLFSTRLSYPQPDTVVCAATGEVDVLTAPLLARAIWTAASRSPEHVVVDLRGVTFFGARGAAVLAEAVTAATGHHRLSLVADGRAVCRVLAGLGLTDLAPRFADLRSALARL